MTSKVLNTYAMESVHLGCQNLSTKTLNLPYRLNSKEKVGENEDEHVITRTNFKSRDLRKGIGIDHTIPGTKVCRSLPSDTLTRYRHARVLDKVSESARTLPGGCLDRFCNVVISANIVL